MLQLVELFVGGAFVFGVGTLVGAHNVPTVDRAIAAIKAEEVKALTVLGKISNHKVTTATVTVTQDAAAAPTVTTAAV